jgi:hypothetical protein
MATRRTNTSGQSGSGFGGLVALILLILALAWPLLVFHRHWSTSSVVNCSDDPSGVSCTYDSNTMSYTGTWVDTTSHTGISATGWIVEAAWVGLIGTVALAVITSSAKEKSASEQAANRLRVGHDVRDPALPTSNPPNSGQLVRFTDLDTLSRNLLSRTQRAITQVLTCKVYDDDHLRQAVTEPTLRRHEWAIAASLREITNLRTEQAKLSKSLPMDAPAPLTNAVLSAQETAVRQKLESVESLVQAIESYASRVKAADAARLDWESAAELAKLNPRFSDLIAATAADEVQLQEVHDMTAEAATFQDALLQANLAAQPLLLPDLTTE